MLCQMLPNEGQSQAGVCPPLPLLHFPINELAGDLTPGCLALARIQSWEWATGSLRVLSEESREVRAESFKPLFLGQT